MKSPSCRNRLCRPGDRRLPRRRGQLVFCLDVDAEEDRAPERAARSRSSSRASKPIVKRNSEAGRLQFSTDVAAKRGARRRCSSSRSARRRTRTARRICSTWWRPRAAIGRHMQRLQGDGRQVDRAGGNGGPGARRHQRGACKARTRQVPFSVVSNPEFLKEGAAVEDFMRPDRVIVGAEDERAIALLRAALCAVPAQPRAHASSWTCARPSSPSTRPTPCSATRISFMNELANLAEELGADIEEVRRGIGSDPRIGYHFLYPGGGYGGSCFPKDVKALQHTAAEAGRPLRMLRAVEQANEAQKHLLGAQDQARFGERAWRAGASRSGDLRSSPTPTTCARRRASCSSRISSRPARACAPMIRPPVHEARALFAASGAWRSWTRPMAALEGADALAIVTEWKEFRSPDFAAIKAKLKTPAIFDGRNLYDPAVVKAQGLEYFPIGRKP